MSTLTGQTRYRLGWRGKIVLQVGIWYRSFELGRHPDYQPWVTGWRDAVFRDVIDLAEGRFSSKKPAETRMPPPPRPRKEWRDLPPNCTAAPSAPKAAEPTLYNVGMAAESSIEYRFLGITGMEDE
jgi:hypothetical protein